MTSLNDKIRSTIAGFREGLPADLSALIEQGAGEISALDISERALGQGAQAPRFTLARYGGGEATLEGYLADGPLVLTFYRGVWCPYCNLQLKEYSDRLDEITALGATLVAVTPEKPGAVDTLAKAGAPEEIIADAATDVRFDVLHDADNRLARQFGLVFDLPDAHRTVLKQFGVDVLELTGKEDFAFADPATYVIARDGTVFRAFVPNNYRKRTEVDAITNALRDLAAAS